MDQDVRDVLMMMSVDGTEGGTIPGEALAEFGATDTLAKGFKAGSATNGWKSNFFMLRSFKTNIEIKDTQRDRSSAGKTATSGNFSSFVSSNVGSAFSPFVSNFEKVDITKYFDISSITLFKHCTESTTIKTGSLIKRRGGGAQQLSTYLRIDFEDLLITNLDWDEDDVVNEKLSFICRKANVRYKIEQHSGKLSNLVTQHGWSVKP